MEEKNVEEEKTMVVRNVQERVPTTKQTQLIHAGNRHMYVETIKVGNASQNRPESRASTRSRADSTTTTSSGTGKGLAGLQEREDFLHHCGKVYFSCSLLLGQ